MELIGSILILLGAFIIVLTMKKRYELQKEGSLQIKNKMNSENKKTEEDQRKQQILSKVESFLKNSQFMEPVAKWRDENIYRYVFNNGYLYEFEDIMTESNQRIGMDEDFLCFKRLCYKRVNASIEFLNKLPLKILNQ